jgi:plasmid stabilization system protein ParE
MRKGVFKIEISDDAEDDLDSSYSYYFDESSKLADAFFQSIKISLENLKKSPLSFPLIHKNLRKYTVRKFPFVIYYQVEGFIIKVIAIFHTSRNPKIWDERIE